MKISKLGQLEQAGADMVRAKKEYGRRVAEILVPGTRIAWDYQGNKIYGTVHQTSFDRVFVTSQTRKTYWLYVYHIVEIAEE